MTNDKNFVKGAFASIAPRYDLLNTVLSFGIDRLWRKKTIDLLDPIPGEKILDLCAGTLTLSSDLLKKLDGDADIISADFCHEMLKFGMTRLNSGMKIKILPLCGDAEMIPLADRSCHRAAVAYGVRNLSDPNKGIEEIFRVLKPGGRVVILDFLRPTNPVTAPIYKFYLKRILPLIGGVISGAYHSYKHLADSIEAFMAPDLLIRRLEEAGFHNSEVEKLTFGVAGVFKADKPK